MRKVRFTLIPVLALAAAALAAPAGPKVALLSPPSQAGSVSVTQAPVSEALVAGEALCILTPSDPALTINRCFAVDLAGHADLPWLGRYPAAGLSPAQVESDLSRLLAERLKGQPLRVKAAYRLGFLGTWARPGEHFLPVDASLWDALLAAGGPGAADVPVQILRGSEMMVQVSLQGDYPRLARLQGVGIRSGDLFVLTPSPAAPRKTAWELVKEGLTVSAQLAAVMGSLLSAWLTWDYLKQGGAI